MPLSEEDIALNIQMPYIIYSRFTTASQQEKRVRNEYQVVFFRTRREFFRFHCQNKSEAVCEIMILEGEQ